MPGPWRPRLGKGARASGEESGAHLPCLWDPGSAGPLCRWRSGSPPQRTWATQALAPCSPPDPGPCARPPPPLAGSPRRGRCPGCSGESWRRAVPRSGHRNPTSCSRRLPPRCRTCLRTSAGGPDRWCPAGPSTQAGRPRGSCPSPFGPKPWFKRQRLTGFLLQRLERAAAGSVHRAHSGGAGGGA